MIAASIRNYFLNVTSFIFDVVFGVVHDDNDVVRWVSCVEIFRPRPREFIP